MKIFLDAMGGDNAPGMNIDGAVEALRENSELSIILAGVESEINAYISKMENGIDDIRGRLEILNAPDTITNHDAPVMAVRRKTESSIVKGMLYVKDGLCDGFVSAGSTGAVLAGGMFKLGRIDGIDRPALAPLLPNGKGYFLLIDCGANVDCQPDWLVQFGLMGSAYMKGVMGLESPRVGLINIGDEPEKGNALVKEVFPLMEKRKAESLDFNFVGNVEARYITGDIADVLVADGFAGNLVLKFMEGVAGTLMKIIKKELMADFRGKLGGMIAKPAFRRVAKTMDYTEVGGAPLLGVNGVVVKAHGSSNGHAMACAIKQAVKMADGQVVPMIAKLLTQSESQSNPSE